MSPLDSKADNSKIKIKRRGPTLKNKWFRSWSSLAFVLSWDKPFFLFWSHFGLILVNIMSNLQYPNFFLNYWIQPNPENYCLIPSLVAPNQNNNEHLVGYIIISMVMDYSIYGLHMQCCKCDSNSSHFAWWLDFASLILLSSHGVPDHFIIKLNYHHTTLFRFNKRQR